mmetsp:Transcript_14641/g.30462  ORF Transcript_14641/g.30462 Transcript_14641/m.30462 type:complete len:736 (+) Transcript_14641:161-2368(+)
MADTYVAPTYEAPGLFLLVGSVLQKIVVGRDVDTPNSILAFVSGNRAEQVEYIEGLVGIGIFLSCLVSIWFLTLLLLKCQGRDRMGCAAGFPFHDSDSDDKLQREERRKRGGASGTLFRGDGQDVSEGAAVGDDDSVAMDELARRGLRQKSLQRHKSNISSRLAMMFGSKKKMGTQAFSKSSTNSNSNSNNKGAMASSRGARDGRPWSVINDYDYLDGNCTFDSKHLEEIELHMELDNIVQSATRDSEEKTKRKADKKPWTLRSLPKNVTIGDETDDEFVQQTRSGVPFGKACGQTFCCSFEPEHVSRRKACTRFVFALFAVLSVICCALLVTHMYLPLESGALTSGEVVEDTSRIVDEINKVLEVVDEAASATATMLQTTPLQYEVICPEFPVESFAAQFGFNPKAIIDTVSKEYQKYLPTIVESLNTAKETGESITNVLADVHKGVSKVNEYLWIIPLIICVTILITFSQLALMAAIVYKEKKFSDIGVEVPKVENCFGWTIIPLQLLVVLASWILVIAFCFGIVIATDSCIPSISTMELDTDVSSSISMENAFELITSSRGTPEDTILAVLDQYMLINTDDDGTSSLIDDLAKRRLSMYITGCKENPLAELVVVQNLLQESLTSVDTQASFATDVLGLDFIERSCGASNQVKLFFDNLTVVNKQFANLDRAIDQAYNALSCQRVNALYVEAVHGALCTDFATANTNGLLFLILISFSGMVLITLRAACRSAE